jgi:hypothetical protein
MTQDPIFTSSDFSLARPGREAPAHQAQSFGRFEFKYLLNAHTRARLEPELRDFMEIDPFCRDRPDQSYLVRSLYFDDDAFSAYHEKIDGLLVREKFRLRTYDAPGTAPCYLEIKGRQNHYSYKYRSPLDAHLQGLIAARRWSALALTKSGSPVTERFAATATRRRLLPQAVVEYVRRPYVSRRDYRFRATFDSDIRGFRSVTLDRRRAGGIPVLRGLTVFEIKFEHALPVWFQRLIGTYELQRLSVSKYCRAAEALTLVTNLE